MATGICPWCGKTVDKFIMFRGDIVGCRYCGIHTKQTNADKLRSMSDEELANRFSEIIDCDRGCDARKDKCWMSDSTCRLAWLDWLKQEAKE